MKLSIIGTGYVGLVTGTCFAEMGNTVYCVDTDQKKIDALQQGIIPIYEPGLSELVKDNYQQGNLHFTTQIQEALQETSLCFIAVGTPMDKDGSADLQYVLEVAREIGQYMVRDMVVVDKSTVPVGTADKVAEVIQEQLNQREVDYKFQVVSNPEFLKEGCAVKDCMSPDRIVIGVPNPQTEKMMRELYDPFIRNRDRFIVMDVRSAEMTKYASNAMLATRISFMNEMANICERVGANINQVRKGMGSDSRIGYSFLYAGCGYGGSCFPKDVQALMKTAHDHGYEAQILQSVEAVNYDQKRVLIRKILKKYGENLSGKIFALWGLAFKPETDDMREAASVVMIHELIKRGATIRAYDPKATETARQILSDVEGITYETSKYTALCGVDALILVTEWKEFRSPDFDEMKMRMKAPVIFDGRNQYHRETLNNLGFEYIQIGVK